MRQFYVQSKQFIIHPLLLTDNMKASSFICTTLCFAIYKTATQTLRRRLHYGNSFVLVLCMGYSYIRSLSSVPMGRNPGL
jgi:hypothetical protein